MKTLRDELQRPCVELGLALDNLARILVKHGMTRAEAAKNVREIVSSRDIWSD